MSVKRSSSHRRRPPARARLRNVLVDLLGRVAGRARRRRPPARLRRVLIIRPDHMGDFLFATPALEQWAEQAGRDIHTTLAVGPWNAELAAHGPAVDRIITVPFPGFTRAGRQSLLAPYRLLLRLGREWRAEGFDMAIILRFDHWWAGLLTLFAGIPIRLGYDTYPLRACLTHPVPYTGEAHEVERNMALIQNALQLAGRTPIAAPGSRPALIYHITDAEREGLRAKLLEMGIPPRRPMAVIHPTAGAPVKEWPAEYFARVGDELTRRHGASVVISGGPDDVSEAWRVAALMREEARVMAGRTTLPELAVLLAEADLVIGADSGPLHLAVAVGTPTLHLHGPADPALFGPWSSEPSRHRVIMSAYHCAPCNHLDSPRRSLEASACMRAIPPEDVLTTAAEILRETYAGA